MGEYRCGAPVGPTPHPPLRRCPLPTTSPARSGGRRDRHDGGGQVVHPPQLARYLHWRGAHCGPPQSAPATLPAGRRQGPPGDSCRRSTPDQPRRGRYPAAAETTYLLTRPAGLTEPDARGSPATAPTPPLLPRLSAAPPPQRQ